MIRMAGQTHFLCGLECESGYEKPEAEQAREVTCHPSGEVTSVTAEIARCISPYTTEKPGSGPGTGAGGKSGSDPGSEPGSEPGEEPDGGPSNKTKGQNLSYNSFYYEQVTIEPNAYNYR